MSKDTENRLTKSQSFELLKGKENWAGQELEVKSDPLIDAGMGKLVTIRRFFFSKNPDPKVRLPIHNQDLFNAHWNQIRDILWRDGLRPIDEVNPRVIRGKKGYNIFITCEPRITGAGVQGAFSEKGKTLQTILSKKR